MPKIETIQENKEGSKEEPEKLLTEIFLICQSEDFFTEKQNKYNNLEENINQYKEAINHKNNLLEKSNSYKESLESKLEYINERILNKRIKLLEELGSNL